MSCLCNRTHALQARREFLTRGGLGIGSLGLSPEFAVLE